MFRAILFCAAVFVASVVPAAEGVKVYLLKAGYYMAQGGDIVPVKIITPDDPDDPDDPVVPPQSTFTKALVDAVSKIQVSDKRHEQAMKMVGVLQVVETKVGDGTLPQSSAGQAVNLLAKAALGNTNAETWRSLLEKLESSQLFGLLEKAGGAYDTWTPVISLIESELSKQSDKVGCTKVLKAAADAILSTIPNSGPALEMMRSGKMMGENNELMKLAQVYSLDWDKFMMFLIQILQVLLPLIIS